MFELVEDLRDMGEGNAILGRYVSALALARFAETETDWDARSGLRRTLLKRDTLVAASSIYEG